MKKYAIVFWVVVSLLLSACSSGRPSIELETDTINFGDVVNGDVVDLDIAIRNIGAAPLVITTTSTTCGCTKASMDSHTIQPGETGILLVEFDSGAHGPDLVGQITRQIFIESNDPIAHISVVEITANIVARLEP